jgi:hypothetical protein
MKYFQSFLVDHYLKTASLSSIENSFVLSCLGLLGRGSISDLRDHRLPLLFLARRFGTITYDLIEKK